MIVVLIIIMTTTTTTSTTTTTIIVVSISSIVTVLLLTVVLFSLSYVNRPYKKVQGSAPCCITCTMLYYILEGGLVTSMNRGRGALMLSIGLGFMVWS